MPFKFSFKNKFLNFYQKSEIAVSILIITLGACFAIFMPNMIAIGGMVQAQDFIRLSPIFFPRISFGVLSILGIVYLIQILKAPNQQQKEGT